MNVRRLLIFICACYILVTNQCHAVIETTYAVSTIKGKCVFGKELYPVGYVWHHPKECIKYVCKIGQDGFYITMEECDELPNPTPAGCHIVGKAFRGNFPSCCPSLACP